MLGGWNVHWAVIHPLLYLFNSLFHVLQLPCAFRRGSQCKSKMMIFYQSLSYFIFFCSSQKDNSLTLAWSLKVARCLILYFVKKKIIQPSDILPVISQGHQEGDEERWVNMRAEFYWAIVHEILISWMLCFGVTLKTALGLRTTGRLLYEGYSLFALYMFCPWHCKWSELLSLYFCRGL